MVKILSPEKNFSGRVIGVTFEDGEANADLNPNQEAYFRRHRYGIDATPIARQVEGVEVPEGAPKKSWKVDELKAYAVAHDIPLDPNAKKEDIWSALHAQGEEANTHEAPGDTARDGAVYEENADGEPVESDGEKVDGAKSTD